MRDAAAPRRLPGRWVQTVQPCPRRLDRPAIDSARRLKIVTRVHRYIVMGLIALCLLGRSVSLHAQVCGDHDGNGVIAATDALLVLKHAVGEPLALLCPPCPTAGTTTTTMPEAALCGDDDGSGAVAATDALLVLKKAVGQEVELQCPGCFGTLVLDAASSGFYDQTGHHQAGNYAVGWYAAPNDDELRDYFVFDLPPITGTITGAHLLLTTAPQGFIRYGSNDPSETYTLFDVTSAIDTLADGTAGVSAFDDLGEGTSYGGVVATGALGETVEVPFDAAGLAAVSAAAERFAVGGTVTTLSRGATNEFLFNSTSASLTRQLILTVE